MQSENRADIVFIGTRARIQHIYIYIYTHFAHCQNLSMTSSSSSAEQKSLIRCSALNEANREPQVKPKRKKYPQTLNVFENVNRTRLNLTCLSSQQNGYMSSRAGSWCTASCAQIRQSRILACNTARQIVTIALFAFIHIARFQFENILSGSMHNATITAQNLDGCRIANILCFVLLPLRAVDLWLEIPPKQQHTKQTTESHMSHAICGRQTLRLMCWQTIKSQ